MQFDSVNTTVNVHQPKLIGGFFYIYIYISKSKNIAAYSI